MNFYKLEREILLRTDINIGEKVLFSILVFKQGKNPNSWGSQAMLAKEMGVGINTIKRMIKHLQERGYVSKKRFGNGKTNRYKVTGISQPILGLQDRAIMVPPQPILGLLDSPKWDFIVKESGKRDNKPPPTSAREVGGGFLGEIPPPQTEPDSEDNIFRTGWRNRLVKDGDYDWDDAKDDHAVCELEEFLATADISQERFDVLYNECWDDYLDVKKNIQSIPAVLVYRLRKLYGNRK